MIGKRLHDVFSPSAAAEMWRELSTVFDTGERQYFEVKFETSKADLWLGAWLVPMVGEEGECEAVMGVARDVTDRKRLEHEFTQAQKMEAVGRLAGGIAHDFNNLLTAILGYSDLLLERHELKPDVSRIFARSKMLASARAGSLGSCSTFSRRQPFAPQILDVNGVVGELHKMLGRIIGEDIRIELFSTERSAVLRRILGRWSNWSSISPSTLGMRCLKEERCAS